MKALSTLLVAFGGAVAASLPFEDALPNQMILASEQGSSSNEWYSCQDPFKPSADPFLSTPRLALGPNSPPSDLPPNLAWPNAPGAFEQWDFDMIILQNETEFFFTWRTDVKDEKPVSSFEIRYVLPDKTVFSRVIHGELLYESSGVRAVSLSANRFSWTPDRHFYVVEVDVEGFRARLFYENVLFQAPFSAKPNDNTYELLPNTHYVIPAPRSHVDGWVELDGERWVLQNIGYHSHTWGTLSSENASRRWTLSRVYAWTISILSLTLDFGTPEASQTIMIAHNHDPLFHVRNVDPKRILFSPNATTKGVPSDNLTLRWTDVCGEQGSFDVPALYEIERGISTGPSDSTKQFSKDRVKLGLSGGWESKAGQSEKMEFGLGYSEYHYGPF